MICRSDGRNYSVLPVLPKSVTPCYTLFFKRCNRRTKATQGLQHSVTPVTPVTPVLYIYTRKNVVLHYESITVVTIP